MKIAKLALAAAALTTTAAVAPTVATAQEAAAVTAGAPVYGNDGAEIGTVESIDGETAIPRTACYQRAPNRRFALRQFAAELPVVFLSYR